MNVYSGGSTLTLTVSLVNQNGIALSPQANNITFTVKDETEGVVAQTVPITLIGYVKGDTEITLSINSQINDIGLNRRGLRSVEITTVEDDGSLGLIVTRYALKSGDMLAVGENSYLKFNEAALLTMDMPMLSGWGYANDVSKESAMIEAYNRIGMLTFTVEGVEISSLNTMTTKDFDALSVVFRNAIKKAQISEADVILGGDPVAAKREEGLLADSVGESSVMFRPGKPLIMSVSRRTLNYLSGFVSFSNRLARR